MGTDIKRLKELIKQKLAELDERDAESHIWYSKFLTLIEEIENK